MTKKLFALLMVVMALFMVTPAFAQEATPEASALPTIAEIVVASASGDAPEFTTLLAAVSAADPSVLETLSNPELESKLTVFAPTDAAFAALQEALGEEGLYPDEPGMGAEDFSYMTKLAPGAMFSLGAQYDNVKRPHHSPIFDLDENAFPIGAAILAETACRLLKLKA